MSELKQQLTRLAIVEAFVEPNWESRYFSFDPEWGPNESVASYRNGSGDSWFVLFGQMTAFKGLEHEFPLLDIQSLPEAFVKKFASFLEEPAFMCEYASAFAFLDGETWRRFGHVSEFDFRTVANWSADDYVVWASEYYERDVDRSSVSAAFSGDYSRLTSLQTPDDPRAFDSIIADFGVL